MVPEMFAEQPDPKRRAEQELAYKTLKHCVCSGVADRHQHYRENGKDGSAATRARDATMGQEDALRGQLESIGHHLHATGGGTSKEKFRSNFARNSFILCWEHFSEEK